MERCCVFEYLRTAAISTGVPSASPTAAGTAGNQRNHLIVVKAITARATTQIRHRERRSGAARRRRQRTDQQRDDRHRDGPRRHDTAGVRIAIAEIDINHSASVRTVTL